MKKIFLFFLITVSAAPYSNAQTAATSLSENFNVSCILATGFPASWTEYNPIAATVPAGAWTCGVTEGRGGSPGIMCTGTYSSANHLDTSFLLTPLLNINSYYPNPGHIYMRFDTKTTRVHSGGKFGVVVSKSPDTSASVPVLDSDITGMVFPVIGNEDSSDWVTHQVDLSIFAREQIGPFYIAFRYTSPSTSGNTWYLDNINTTTADLLNVSNVNRTELPLKVIGRPTSGEMDVSYTADAAGVYDLAIYDMVGRLAYKEVLNTEAGTFTNHINNLSLSPGMYVIKMGNAASFAVAKTVVY